MDNFVISNKNAVREDSYDEDLAPFDVKNKKIDTRASARESSFGSSEDDNQTILEKLDYFLEEKQIPNILFYGSIYSNKEDVLEYLIQNLYKNSIDYCEECNYIMKVNCNKGKGIKFIRDELKFFAKTNVDKVHKSVILYNAEFLTLDAQSALRRCIEVFSKTTRFFILIEDKNKLLKPIISRFCDIYVPDVEISNDEVYYREHKTKFDKISRQLKSDKNNLDLANFFSKNGIHSLDLVNYLEWNLPENNKKYEILIKIDFYKRHILHEELLMFHIVNLMRN